MQLQMESLLIQSLQEDITSEDITTNAIVPKTQLGTITLLSKQDGILAGIDVWKRVFTLLDENMQFEIYKKDGDTVVSGEVIGTIFGSVRAILTGERTALNYLQHMSGIATYTQFVVELLKDTNIKVLDTRKTTPNMRVFEKYAVSVGGGYNHRYNLSDGILIKDNHIKAAGSLEKAIVKVKECIPFIKKIEVEVETMKEVKEAIDAKVDIIMLDNMTVEQMKEAIAYIDGRALIECSGNITKETMVKLKDLKIDYISSGALTHSAPILDVSLKHLKIRI